MDWSLATSIDVERVFSHGQLLLSHMRSRLSTQTTQAMLCVGQWTALKLVKTADVQAVSEMKDEEGIEKKRWKKDGIWLCQMNLILTKYTTDIWLYGYTLHGYQTHTHGKHTREKPVPHLRVRVYLGVWVRVSLGIPRVYLCYCLGILEAMIPQGLFKWHIHRSIHCHAKPGRIGYWSSKPTWTGNQQNQPFKWVGSKL